MSSLRVTNYLLLVIAVALALIAARVTVPTITSEAKAAVIPTSAVYLHGCLQTSSGLLYPTGCEPLPVRVTKDGQLVIKAQ